MEQMIGEIRMFAGNFATEGWALCNGQLLSIAGNELLFSLIGTTYGGDGQTTFALPDFRGRIPLNQGTYAGTSYFLGSQGGTETVTLRQHELPPHTHQVSASNWSDQVPGPGREYWAKGDDNLYAAGSSNVQLHSEAISQTGGNEPHENMMPFLCTTFIISLTGEYPSRD